MIRQAPVWQGDPELKADAARLRVAHETNGLDRGTNRRMELVPFGAMQANLTEADLVAGLLGSAQTSAIYGPPGCGKTFLALDIALRVAAGCKWFRRRVTQGPVVYVAAEAGRRIFNRVAAWRLRRMREDDESELPFFVVPIQIDLCNSADDLDELVAAIRETCDSVAPVLIVIDTVSRVMAGGNENSPEDMGAIIASADRLRDEFGANVCLIHHTGKDLGRGARGHSSLFAAIDTAIEITRNDDAQLSTAHVVKQRDGETGEKIHFALDVVTIGQTEATGEDVTSCVVAAPDPARVAEAKRTKPKLGKAEQIALNALEIAVETDGTAPPAAANCPASLWVREEAWRKRCYQDGISHGEEQARRKAFLRASGVLVGNNLVGIQDGYVWPCGT